MKVIFLLGLALLSISHTTTAYGFPSNYAGSPNSFRPFPLQGNFQFSPMNNFNYGQMPPLQLPPPLFTNQQFPQIMVPTPNFPPIQMPTGPGYNVITDSVSVNGSHSAASGASASGVVSGSGVSVSGSATSSGNSNGAGASSNSTSVFASSSNGMPDQGRLPLFANFPYVPYNNNNNYYPSYPYSVSDNLVAVDYSSSQPQVPNYWNNGF